MVCSMIVDASRKWSKCSEEENKSQVIYQLNTMFGVGCKEVPEPISIMIQDWSEEECI
jgi:monoamine oxidase